MKAYKGSFKKKNGEVRQMLFASLHELPEPFLAKHVAGTGSEKTYPAGMELVWDIESDDFRIFNHSTLQEPLKEVFIDESHFN
jgi:hypothetical protein